MIGVTILIIYTTGLTPALVLSLFNLDSSMEIFAAVFLWPIVLIMILDNGLKTIYNRIYK